MRKKPLWALLLIPLIAVSMVSIGGATSSRIYFDPEGIVDKNLTIGSYITIGIGIDYAQDIWGYQVELSFNPEVLRGVSVEDSGFLGSAGGTTIILNGQGFDNVGGKLHLFGAALFEKDPAKCPDGGGILASVTFEVVGYGFSDICTEWDTGVASVTGRWIVHGPDLPPPVFFSNFEFPELYVRRRGAHGVSGVWEEWQVGLVDTTQTLYCRIMNYGEAGAMVKVEFMVRGPRGISKYESNEAWVEPEAGGEPGEVSVSASFVPGPPGKYYASVALYFKADGMTSYRLYYVFQGVLGGEGISRDVNVAFKVVTHK